MFVVKYFINKSISNYITKNYLASIETMNFMEVDPNLLTNKPLKIIVII